jgi:hypothetical protein
MAVPGLDPGISPGHPDGLKRCASPIGITGLGHTFDVMAGPVPAIPFM